jgi:hypothetical protein
METTIKKVEAGSSPKGEMGGTTAKWRSRYESGEARRPLSASKPTCSRIKL